jgi:hypothetical protein
MHKGASGGALPLRATTTAADSKRDARAAPQEGCASVRDRHPSKIIRSCTGSAPANLAVTT